MTEKKACEKCNTEITPINWSRHLKTKNHLNNNPERVINLCENAM